MLKIGLYYTSGFSLDYISLSANLYNYLKSQNQQISLSSLYNILLNYDYDIAIGKIAIRIPINKAFPIDNEKIYLVYDKYPPSESTMKILGYFETKTSGTIIQEGEWQILKYNKNEFKEQFVYLFEPYNIYAFSNGHTIALCGDFPFDYIYGNYLLKLPESLSNYQQLGEFEVKLFYDKINLDQYITSSIILNSNNTISNPLSFNLDNNTVLNLDYISGNFIYNNINYTMYVVSSNNNEIYYGDKNNPIKIINLNNNNFQINIYTNINDSSGSILLKYLIKQFN